MHLGNARTALLAWLQARAAGGSIVMRIEDLDTQRVVAGAEDRLLDELRWLGLDWDGEIVRQSERADRYAGAIAQLLAEGKAFECACSRAEIARAASAPHADEEGPRYPGTCRDLARGEAAKRAAAAGRGVAVRFRGEGTIAFEDLLRGPVSLELDDFVIRRADGIAAYQLAVVVDDAAQAITHVLRADDLLDSTPRQLGLYRALGLTAPAFAHVPLVLAPGGERLAKRNRPAAVGDLRAAGVAPEAVVGMLAASAGLVDEGARATPRELIAAFELRKIARQPAVLAAREDPVVRAPTGADVIALAQVYVASWRAGYRGIVPDEVLDALSVVAQTARWQKLLAGIAKSEQRAFLVEENREVRGFIVTGPLRGAEASGAGEVWAMYLDPASWRRGLGRRLLTHAEEDLASRGHRPIAIWVLAKNARAREFYAACGYSPTGETRVNQIGSAPLEEVRYTKEPG